MEKGIRGHDIREKGLVNISRKAKECGIKYLQLVLEKSIDGFETGNFTKEYAEEIKKELGDTRVAILGSYINPSNPDDEGLKNDIEKFKEKIKYASVLNPIAVGTETGTYKDGMTDSEEAYQRVLSTMKEIVAEAEKYDVNIGIEAVHFFVINTPQKMKRIIDDLNSDNVRVIFDPTNYISIDNYKNQHQIFSDVFELLADKICVIHIKDFAVENGSARGVKPMEGIIDYKFIMQKMNEYNVDVPAICEEINEDDAVIALNKLENLRRD